VNASFPGPHKNHYRSTGTHNTFSFFLLRLMDGIQVPNATMYLNYFLLIFIVWVGAVEAKEVDNIKAKIMSVR